MTWVSLHFYFKVFGYVFKLCLILFLTRYFTRNANGIINSLLISPRFGMESKKTKFNKMFSLSNCFIESKYGEEDSIELNSVANT